MLKPTTQAHIKQFTSADSKTENMEYIQPSSSNQLTICSWFPISATETFFTTRNIAGEPKLLHV